MLKLLEVNVKNVLLRTHLSTVNMLTQASSHILPMSFESPALTTWAAPPPTGPLSSHSRKVCHFSAHSQCTSPIHIRCLHKCDQIIVSVQLRNMWRSCQRAATWRSFGLTGPAPSPWMTTWGSIRWPRASSGSTAASTASSMFHAHHKKVRTQTNQNVKTTSESVVFDNAAKYNQNNSPFVKLRPLL